jgi:hypothetical protein
MSAAREYFLYCLTATVLLWAAWVALHIFGIRLAHENGPMENQQAACLGIAAILFLACAFRITPSAGKLVMLSLGLFCLMFMVRELELKQTRAPAWLITLLDGKVRNAWLGVLWCVLLVVGWRERTAIWRCFVTWLRSPAGWIMVAAGCFYALTWPLDKEFLPLEKKTSTFIEELGDSTATLLMMLSAICTLRSENSSFFAALATHAQPQEP